MMKKSEGKFVNFLAGKGFYVVLLLCIIAIGVAGYMLLFSGPEPEEYVSTLGEDSREWTLPEPAPAYEYEPSAPVLAPVTPTPPPRETIPTPSRMESTMPTVTPAPTPGKVSDETSLSPSPSPSPSAPPAKSPFVWPLQGAIVQAFAKDELLYNKTMSDWRVHVGVDIAASPGAQVCAVSDGKVSDIYEDILLGTTVVIEHSEGVRSVYGNLMKNPTVALNDNVKAGDVIGGVGDTALGESNEVYHLHLEIYRDGEAVDPLTVLPPKE